MDHYPDEDKAGGEPNSPTDWIAEFRRQADQVRAAAEEWAIRWSEPEGRFISAMLGLLQAQSRLVVSAQASLQSTMQLGRDRVELELGTACKLKESIEALTRQTRTVHLLTVVQQENAVKRMIDDTLPLFAKSLDGALQIRETRWNRRKARIGFAYAGLMFLGVFLAGYGLSTWSSYGPLLAFDRCLASTTSVNGHSYCRLDAVMPSQAPSEPN